MKLFGTLLVFFLASFATAAPLPQDGLGRRGPGDTLKVKQQNPDDGTFSRFTVSANPKGPHPKWDPAWFGGEEHVVETLKAAAIGAMDMADYNLAKNLKMKPILRGDPQKTEDPETAYTWRIEVTPGKGLIKGKASEQLQVQMKKFLNTYRNYKPE